LSEKSEFKNMIRIVIPKKAVWATAFSPNGEYLATASADKTARLWKANGWQEVACMRHEHQVKSLAFSPDSHYLATASFDKTALWEVPSGREVSRISHNCDVRAVAFSPDGKYLVTASGDGTAQVWLWRPEDLIDAACNRLTRNLTPEEWQQYLSDEPYRKTCPNLL
jgi:WD40 repeat protein